MAKTAEADDVLQTRIKFKSGGHELASLLARKVDLHKRAMTHMWSRVSRYDVTRASRFVNKPLRPQFVRTKGAGNTRRVRTETSQRLLLVVVMCYARDALSMHDLVAPCDDDDDDAKPRYQALPVRCPQDLLQPLAMVVGTTTTTKMTSKSTRQAPNSRFSCRFFVGQDMDYSVCEVTHNELHGSNSVLCE